MPPLLVRAILKLLSAAAVTVLCQLIVGQSLHAADAYEVQLDWKIGDMVANPAANLVYVVNETEGDLLAVSTETGSVVAHKRFNYDLEGARCFNGPHASKKVIKRSNSVDLAPVNRINENMKAKKSLLVTLAVFAITFASVATSQAVVVVYKVSFVAKARFFPANNPTGNSFRHRGYLIYDTANPAASITVELVPRTRTYRVQSSMINNIAPSSINFFPLDRNSDAFFEIQGGLITANGISRSYLGRVSRIGIRFGNSLPITGIARVLRGVGAVSGGDQFRTTDVWRMDSLTAAGPVNTSAGLGLVTARLAGRGFVQVP